MSTNIIGENLVLQYSAVNKAPDGFVLVLLYLLHLHSIDLIGVSLNHLINFPGTYLAFPEDISPSLSQAEKLLF